jgi:hypothetical protein
MPKWEARVDAGLRESSPEHLLLEHLLLAARLGVVYRGAL